MSTTSQVVFNIDSKLKAQAMKKAKVYGLPFSSVLKFVINAFVNDQINVGIVEDFNEKTRKEIRAALKDISKGKNLSPRFSTVAESRAWLDN